MKILLIFTLCLISDGGASMEVTGYSGGGVLIKCKYDAGYTENLKYFCKGSWLSCDDQIKTGTKNEWVNSGRFSLFDDTKSAEFWVMIRELTVQDTGTYHCGVDQKGKDIYTTVKLTVKEGDLVSREVTAYTGGGIKIKFRYEDEYEDNLKSFCKKGAQWCVNKTKAIREWTHDGRFSSRDRKSDGFFTVFIRELITNDTGTYMFAVNVSDEIQTYTEMKLNVEDLSYAKPIIKTVHVGGDLTFSCKYPQSLRSDTKFLCKRLQTADCSYKVSAKESRKEVNVGKFSLYDDRAKQNFTVSIRNVSEQDSGEYWCATDHGYKIYFTQINLTVTATPSNPNPTQNSVVSSSTSSSSSLSSASSGPKPTIAPKGFSQLSTVGTVLVNVLIGLLIGSTCLCLIFYIKHKIQGRRASRDKQPAPGSGNSHEGFEDTRNVFASEAATPTGYSTEPLPTTTTVSTNTTLPHDSASSALPTGPSDSSMSAVEEFADGLTYATVYYHPNAASSDNAAPKVRFKKEEEMCEYATVSHRNS